MQPATITVEPRDGVTLSQAIGAMRVWLDSEGIEPASFKPVALPSAKGIGFEVGFATLDAAASFSREFG
jgi:hypothetical protein